MKDAVVVLFAAVAVVVIGMAVFFITPGLQTEAAQNASQADLLVETARRQLGQYQPSLALVKTFLPEADWLSATAQLDADALRERVEENAEDMEKIDEVLRHLATAYDRGRAEVPEGSRQTMLDWGLPEALIEDAFQFAGEAGKRSAEYQERLGGSAPRTGDPLLRGLGAGPAQQSRALREAVARINEKCAANQTMLDDAATQLGQAVNLVPQHLAANRLMAMVEYQRALQRRFEGLGRRRLAERDRPRLIELASRAKTLKARSGAIQGRRNIQVALDQLNQADGELGGRVSQQEQTVSRLQEELSARTQAAEAKRAQVERTRQAYEDALRASYDTDAPGAFADHLRKVEQAGRAMSAAVAELEAAENGTVAGVQLDPPDDPLTGRYLPAAGASEGQYVRGVTAISRELTIEQARLERVQAARQEIVARGEHLEQVRDHLTEELGRYDDQVAALNKQINNLLDDCQRFVAEAETAEGQGLSDHLNKALGHLKAAQQGSTSRMSQARSAQTEAGGAQAPYLDMMFEEGWLTAGLDALEGEVLLLQASIHLQEANDLRSHLRALTAATEAGVEEADPAAAEEVLEDARLAAAEAAYAAAEKFSQAMRNDVQWVYQANLGAALTMLTQIDPTNQEYRDKALEA